MQVSAAVKLMPRPPALVHSRNTNLSESGLENLSIAAWRRLPLTLPSILSYGYLKIKKKNQIKKKGHHLDQYFNLFYLLKTNSSTILLEKVDVFQLQTCEQNGNEEEMLECLMYACSAALQSAHPCCYKSHLAIPNKSGLPLGFHSQSIKEADEKQATCALCFHCKRHDYYGLCISLGKKIEQIRYIYQCVQNMCLSCSNQCPLSHLKERRIVSHLRH